MGGKTQLLPNNSRDFNDPFNAGQMVGMLVMITFLEKQQHVPGDQLEKLKWVCAENASIFMDKPPEDVFLIIDNIVKDM